MSWLSQITGDVSHAWNSQPTWAKGLEIGGAAALTGGAALGLAGVGPLAGLLGGAEAAGAGTLGGAEAAGTLGAAGTAGAGIDFGTSALAGLSDFGSLGSFAGGASGAAGAGADALALAAPDTSTLAGAPAEQAITTALAPAAAPAGTAPVDLTSISGVDPLFQNTADLAGTQNASGAGGSFLDKIGGLVSSPAAKIAGPIASAGALGYSLYSGNQQSKALTGEIGAYQDKATAQTAAATAAATPAINTGETLSSYLATGKLPPATQAKLDKQTAAAKAAIVANHARNGQSTDPTQNSALAAELANADSQALIAKGDMEATLNTAGQEMIKTANSLITSGLKATEISSELEKYLINLDQTTSLNTGKAISNFAASLAPQGGRSAAATT